MVSGHLFFLDGGSSTIYEIDPNGDGFGNGNDSSNSYSIGGLGPDDWEGLAYDPTPTTCWLEPRTTRRSTRSTNQTAPWSRSSMPPGSMRYI